MTAGEFVWELVVGAFDVLSWPFDSGCSLKAWLTLGALVAAGVGVSLMANGRTVAGALVLGAGGLLGLFAWWFGKCDARPPWAD